MVAWHTMKLDRARFSKHISILLKAALMEDVGPCAITGEILIPKSSRGKARIIAKDEGIFCGGPLVEQLAKLTDRRIKIRFPATEGSAIRKGQTVARLDGPIASILKFERTALNLLGQLSGIASRTRCFVNAVKQYPVLILDTRKTTPLWREAEKYAVRIGGGKNHRMGLYDGILVKENHRHYGKLKNLSKWRGRFEIEVRNQKELYEALALAPRVIMFDNFSPTRLRRAVTYVRRRSPDIILEASGGISVKNVARYARCGVDWISVGSLTHSVTAVDFSLLI